VFVGGSTSLEFGIAVEKMILYEVSTRDDEERR
jgi:hypothetical protein